MSPTLPYLLKTRLVSTENAHPCNTNVMFHRTIGAVILLYLNGIKNINRTKE